MKARPFHHQRPLAAAAAAFGLGVWTGAHAAWNPWLCVFGFICGALMTVALPMNGKRRAAGVMVACCFLGTLVSELAMHPYLPDEGKYQLTGVVSGDISFREDGRASGYLENATLFDGEKSLKVSGLYWTYWPEENAPTPAEGDRVRFQGRVYHPNGQMNPYGFDFRLYLLQKGIASGVSGGGGLKVLDHPGRGVSSLLFQIRKALKEKMEAIFGEGSALPEALLLGDRSGLPEETIDSFRDAGAAHLLAVSGLHVGLLAAALLLPLRRKCSPKVRLAVLTAFLLFYAGLLGFPPSVVRASLLLLIMEGRKIVRRALDPLTALSAAFFVMLLFRPLDLFSASFQLSFCAMLGIVVFKPLLDRHVPVFPLSEEIKTTLTATLGSFLPTIQIFHRFSPLGLIVNPVLCLLFAALLPVYAIILAAGCVYLPLGAFLGRCLNPVTRGVTAGIDFLGNLPFATVRVPFLPWFMVIAVVAALALLSRYTLGKMKIKALAALALLLLGAGGWLLSENRNVQYLQLAVGQADCALILDGPETVMIDAGDYGGDAANFLLSTGRNIDHLIITHLHSDHFMGLEQILNRDISIGTVYLPLQAENQQVDEKYLALLEELKERGVPILHVSQKDSLALNRVGIEFTWPMDGTVRAGMDANRYCLSMLCTLNGTRLFTAGDLTGEYEVYAARNADILKVSHHGSKSSTRTPFLEAVSPRIAIVTSNGQSQCNPHPDTLSRLEGIPVYDTGKCGAVMVTVYEHETRVDAYLPYEGEKE